MYKKILFISTGSYFKIAKLLQNNGFKVDVISDKISFTEFKNILYSKNYEIVLTSTCTDPYKRSEIHKFMFKNFPMLFYVTLVHDLKKSCSIKTCSLLQKNKCASTFINYTDHNSFLATFKNLINTHKITLQGELLKNLFDINKEFLVKYEQYFMSKKETFLTKNGNIDYIDYFIKKIFNLITKKLLKMFCPEKISIFLYDSNTEKYKLVSSYGFKTALDDNLTVQNNWKIINYAIKAKKSLLLQDGLKKYRNLYSKNIISSNKIISSIILPLTFDNNVLGIICITRLFPNKKMFSKQEFHISNLFAKWISYIYFIIIKNRIIIEYDILKSNFISIINHELRTPLMVLSAAIELAEKNLSNQLYDLAKRNIKRLDGLIEQLLDFSRMDKGKFVIIKKENSISDLINEIVEEYTLNLKSSNINLQLELNHTTDKFYFDRDRIKQVITNLLNNSIKFMPIEQKSKHIIIRTNETLNKINFCIEDNGQGIEEKSLKTIFNPFVQLTNITTKEKPGFGLGLAISKNIIETHGGNIWAESEFGKWTKILFYLPKN